MPMYEYACPDCGFQFEKLQKFEDKAIKICLNCRKRNAHRVISRVALSFKGGGFYVNDSKSSNHVSKIETTKPEVAADPKPEAGTNGAAETKPDGKTETKAETISETKTEAKPESKADVKTAKPAKKPD